MTVAIIMAALVLAYAAANLYFRKATAYLAESEGPWDRLYEAAREAVADADMPNEVAAFSAAAVMCAGCGCLTRQILFDQIALKLRLKKRSAKINRPKLSEGQRDILSRVVLNATYYDSLRAPLAGFLLRRFVLPGLRQAASGEAPAKSSKVMMMADASRTAISHRKEGKRLLHAA